MTSNRRTVFYLKWFWSSAHVDPRLLNCPKKCVKFYLDGYNSVSLGTQSRDVNDVMRSTQVALLLSI